MPAEGTERPQSARASRFDGVAATYDAVRPGYPDDVFDAIRAYGRLAARPRVLEVGIGTGQATAQMGARGWCVVGIEPGERLASLARDRLATLADVSVVTATFEAAAVETGGFDVVASATAWHWVDPLVGYEKAARCLRPDGVIALWWNGHVPDTPDAGWVPIRRTYEEVAPISPRSRASHPIAPTTTRRPSWPAAAGSSTSCNTSSRSRSRTRRSSSRRCSTPTQATRSWTSRRGSSSTGG